MGGVFCSGSISFLVPDEDELIVVVPAIFLCVHARLGFRCRAGSSGSAASGHAVSVVVQIVESLLDVAVLQEEPRGVPIRATMIRIPGLVQRIAEHLAALGHSAADQDARQLPELDVGQSVFAELEAATVADGDASGWSSVPLAADALEHGGQLKVLRLPQQPLSLAESFGKVQRLVAQEVQDVAEEDAVTVQEVATLAVLGQRIATLAKEFRQQRALILQQCGQCGRVAHAADVQLDDFGHDVCRLRIELVISNETNHTYGHSRTWAPIWVCLQLVWYWLLLLSFRFLSAKRVRTRSGLVSN